jgi:hypothetical protein
MPEQQNGLTKIFTTGFYGAKPTDHFIYQFGDKHHKQELKYQKQKQPQ